MAEHLNNGRSRRDSRHVRIYSYEYNSPAFRALTPNERVVYFELRKRYNGSNNGRIALSAREAGEVCHKSKNVGARALLALAEKGFIKCHKDFAFNNKHHLAREYELTAYSMKNIGDGKHRHGSKDFLRWRPEKK